MPDSLNYGYRKPAAGDQPTQADGWTTVVEEFFTRISDHRHDNLDSVALLPQAIASTEQALTAGNWSLVADGIYKQSVTMTSPLTYDGTHISARMTSSGDLWYPSIEKTGANSFDIYINDNTLDVTLNYR